MQIKWIYRETYSKEKNRGLEISSNFEIRLGRVRKNGLELLSLYTRLASSTHCIKENALNLNYSLKSNKILFLCI